MFENTPLENIPLENLYATIPIQPGPGVVGINNTSTTNKGMSQAGKAALSAAGNIVGKMGNKLISDGFSADGSEIFDAAGDIFGQIPGPIGAIGSAASGILGGIFTRGFGAKYNEKNIQNTQNTIDALNNFSANATTTQEAADLFRSAPDAFTFSNSYIGKDGWFNHKATRRANKLREEMANAENRKIASINNNTNNVLSNNTMNLNSTFAAFGGDLHNHGIDWNNGLRFINTGDTHENNPLGGVPMGIAPDGEPNLVEEGEVIFNDYVFSKRLNVPKAIRQKYKLRGKKELSFADAAAKLQAEAEERPNDPISKRGLEENLGELAQAQEDLKQEQAMRQAIAQQAEQKAQELAYLQELQGLNPEDLQALMQSANQDMPQEEVPEEALMGAYGG